jgi:type VI secretion system secreted protein VgrG
MPDKRDDSAATLQCTASAPLDVLSVRSLQGNEAVSQLFEFTLECMAQDTKLDLASAIGLHVSVTLRAGSVERIVDGLCARITAFPMDPGYTRYVLELRPWLWWLSLASNNRIFQAKSLPEIVEAVFKAHGYSDYELKLTGSYDTRDYCVQYGESDFAFVSRLMEEAGIFYFFLFESQRHVMVLADTSDAFLDCGVSGAIRFMPGEVGVREQQVITEGQLRMQAVSGSYQASDYEFKTPSTSLYAQAQAKSGASTIYEYPGGYFDKASGDAITKRRVSDLRTREQEFAAASTSRALGAGLSFTLSDHDRDDANIKWAVLEIGLQASHEAYHNRFVAIPASTTYYPPRITPRPRIHSTQLAIVVGKSGEEIWTDAHGRIKVQFYWDREGKNDENSSCWIRVAQLWAGAAWGGQFIPRIGQEVVVSFVDGDPDRPLVTGCVYNGSNALPYACPDNQTKSTIKSQSSKGGNGFNEIRFEDKADSEEIYLHAQKDFKTDVLHDETWSIGNDETRTVKQNQTLEVQEGNQKVTIAKGNRTVDVSTGDDALTVKGKLTRSVTGDEKATNAANFTQSVSGDFKLTVSGNLTIEVSGAIQIKAGQNFNAEAGTSLTNKAGTELTNKAGTTLTNDAGVSLTNKAAASQTVDGGGMLTLKGGLVKLN